MELSPNGSTGNVSEGDNLVLDPIAAAADSDTPFHLKLPDTGDRKGVTSTLAAVSQQSSDSSRALLRRSQAGFGVVRAHRVNRPCQLVFPKHVSFARLAN